MTTQQGNRLTIEVIEGLGIPSRSIALLGRALPYQRVSWGGAMRHKLTWYPGNPEATLQVLGPDEEPSVFQGTWKDRYLPNQVEARGFPDLADATQLTAERLVQAFAQLRRQGARLRVQWASEVREGILSRFTPTYLRIQDIEWEAEFTWYVADQVSPRAAAPPPDSRSQLRQRLDENDRAISSRPQATNAQTQVPLRATVREERVQVGQVFDALRTIADASGAIGASTPAALAAVSAIASSADTVRRASADEIERLADLPYTQATAFDTVAEVLTVEAWRRGVASAQGALAATLVRVASAERQRVVPGTLLVVTVPGDTTLRQLSLTYYGSSDDWQRIADANAIVGSIVPAGTIIVVPPAAAGS